MDQLEQRMLLFPCSQMQPAARQGSRRRRRRKAKGGEGEEAKKRRLSDAQAKFLETSFLEERKLESSRKARLADELGLDPKQVAVWFQNRRARHKSKQVEDAFTKLRAAHDAVVVEKRQLENEVLELNERLLEVEEEMRKLSSMGVNGGASGSSAAVPACDGDSSQSSAFSHVKQQALIGDAEIMPMHEYYNNFNDCMEWADLFWM